MATSKRPPPPMPPVRRSKRPPPLPPAKRAPTLVQRPTSGRILRYTYGLGDNVFPSLVGASRPCIVVDAYGDPTDEAGELYDVVVYTSGERDFSLKGAPHPATVALVRSGALSKVGVRLKAESSPGCIHWPPGGPR